MTEVVKFPVWKKGFFGLVVLVIFFVLLELLLAVAGIKTLLVTEDPFVGFSENVPLFTEQLQPDGSVLMVTASNKLPAFSAQQFPKVKAANTYRIFCVGGSTTQGHPLPEFLSYCGWLREFLRHADSSRKWEVINAGGLGYASYREAHLLNELAQYQPDLFIVFSGHNEFLEERTYQDIKDEPEWMMDARVALSDTRTYSVIKRGVDRLRKERTNRPIMGSEEKTKLIIDAAITGFDNFTRNDPLKKSITEHFEYNLERMIAISQSAQSRILFINPPANLKDTPPFKSVNSFTLDDAVKKSWDSLYEQGNTLFLQGKYKDALFKFNEALAIDNRHADLNYQIGSTLQNLNRMEEAKRFFQNAIDEDICPLRIISKMNASISNLKTKNIPVLDFVEFIEEKSNQKYGHRIPGDEFFLDHVHLTIASNRLLALAIVDRFAGEGILKNSQLLSADDINFISENYMARFDNRMKTNVLISLAKTFDYVGRPEKAFKILTEKIDTYLDPVNRGLLYDTLAGLALKQGKNDQAIEYWYKVLDLWPNNKSVRTDLALLLKNSGKLNEALRQYNLILETVAVRMKEGQVKYDSKGVYDPITEGDIINVREMISQIESAASVSK